MTEAYARTRTSTGVVLQILAEASREKLPPGTARVRECPLCGAALRWRVGKPTRRGMTVRGACATPDCISFLT